MTQQKKFNFSHEYNYNALDVKIFWNVVIIVVILIMLFVLFFVFIEVYDAKKNCELIDGKYKIGFNLQHTCNGKTYVKYNLGWGFENQYNISFIFKQP